MTMHVVVSGWLLGSPSGANRRLLALLANAGPLLANDERITVLHRPDSVPPSLPGIGWHPLAIPRAPTWRRVLAERRTLVPCLQNLGASVYDHGFLPLPRVPVPTCLLLHDLRAVDGLTRWPRWFARTVLRRSCRRATAIVVPSEWTAQRLRELVPHAPSLLVVPNGVDMPGAASPLALSLPPNGYLLHVGHIEARKNLAVVVRALAGMPPAERPELWLVGRDAGALPRLVALAARLQCDASVRLLGTVPDQELNGLYDHARAVVVPSTHEGFGLCALEGLSHGRPVLASRAGALPEVVGDHGCLLPSDDVVAWSRAIVATAHDETGVNSLRRAHAARFRWQDAAAAVLGIWRRLSADQGTT